MQKRHHNHEDIYISEIKQCKENNLISLWVHNVIHLTASP